VTPEATPAATPVPDSIGALDVPAGLAPEGLADLLAGLPDEVAGLTRRGVQSSADSATAIYLAGEETASPQFGMAVLLVVPPQDDADAVVARLQRERWGDPALHVVTASGDGDARTPAFREFWRTFPPGLFALPNQPVYFLLTYRAGSEHAVMVIAASPAIRAGLIEALAVVLSRESGIGSQG
jgi:hypothetical protein